MLAGFHTAKAFIAILRGTKREATPVLPSSNNNLRCLAFQQPIYPFCSTSLWERALQTVCSGGRDEREIECSQNIRFWKAMQQNMNKMKHICNSFLSTLLYCFDEAICQSATYTKLKTLFAQPHILNPLYYQPFVSLKYLKPVGNTCVPTVCIYYHYFQLHMDAFYSVKQITK